MKLYRFILIVLLAALAAGQWVMIAHQYRERQVRRSPAPRLSRLLEQAQLNEHHLALVAAQNEALTTRTLAILERLAATPAPVVAHAPGAPEVLYEAEPVKKGAHQ